MVFHSTEGIIGHTRMQHGFVSNNSKIDWSHDHPFSKHPTSKKHPSEGFGIAPKKSQKEPKHERQHPTRPKRGFGIAPKKATKEPKHERQHPTSKKHPSEGFGIAPKKAKKTNTKGSTRRARNTQARDLASPPKKARQHLLDRGNLDRIWAFWDYKMVFHSA